MPRPLVFLILLATVLLFAFWLLLQTPGSLNDALAHPLQALVGTSRGLNSILVQASESADPVRAAGQRLLQPFGVVRLIRISSASDAETTQKQR